jgi:hypothetical protein
MTLLPVGLAQPFARANAGALLPHRCTLTPEGAVTEVAFRPTTSARKGPRGRRHVRRSLKDSLKRSLLAGEYRAEDPRLVPEREDLRYSFPASGLRGKGR